MIALLYLLSFSASADQNNICNGLRRLIDNFLLNCEYILMAQFMAITEESSFLLISKHYRYRVHFTKIV